MNDVSDDQSVKFIRLNSGDDIVSQVVEVGDETQIDYILINPLKIVYIPSEKGSAYLQVAFMPWVFTRICSEQEFLIHAEDVITMGNVSNYMADYYWRNMDHFMGSIEDAIKESEEIETEEELDLEGILEAINSAKRTFH